MQYQGSFACRARFTGRELEGFSPEIRVETCQLELSSDHGDRFAQRAGVSFACTGYRHCCMKAQ